VVADALSWLEMEDTPFEDNQESFLGLLECFAKQADKDEFHPLNYQQLKDFYGGGKITSLICFKEKIVIPGLLQKQVIDWYHTTQTIL
jgi:hypothetical protein